MFVIPGDQEDLYMSKPNAEVQNVYDAWLDLGSSCIITTSGGQGVGKSLNSRTLFRNLKNPSNLVAYFSFARTYAIHNSFESFLASVILQVLVQDPERFSRVEDLFVTMEISNTWTEASLLVLFRSLLDTKAGLNCLHLIVDDLHHCESALGLVMALAEIVSNVNSPTRLKVALFYDWNINGGDSVLEDILRKVDEHRMHGPTLTIDMRKPLVTSIVDQVISSRPYPSDLRSQLSGRLEECKNTTEVLLVIQILDTTSASRSRRTLKSLESLIDNSRVPISDIVKSTFEHLPSWGRTTLGWIVQSKRPLCLDELTTAVALTDNTAKFLPTFDPSSLPVDPAATIRSIFGPLMRFEGGGVVLSDGVVRNLFQTLIAEERKLEPATKAALMPKIPDEADITRVLFGYLSWQELDGPVHKALKTKPGVFIQPPGELFNLITYAVRFLPFHYRSCRDSDDLPILSRSRQLALLWPKLNYVLNSATSYPRFCVVDPLLLVAQLGFTKMIKALEMKIMGTYRETAIRLASWGGHINAVQELLFGNNVIHTEMIDLAEALEDASVRGHDVIVGYILQYLKDCAPGHPPLFVDRLLCRAAEFGYEKQARWWIELGAEINAAPEKITPLQYATRNGHTSLVHTLLAGKETNENSRAGADVNSKAGTNADEPILLAAMKGYELVAQYLLAAEADITCVTKDNTGRTAMYLAAEYGHEIVIQHLLIADKPKYSTVDRQNSSGNSPLMVACMKGHSKIADLLLQVNASVTLYNEEGKTALYYALHPAGEDLAMAILARTESVEDFKDIACVFLRAAELGHERVVTHCLGSMTLIKVQQMEQGKKALYSAASRGHLGVVELLLQNGLEVDPNDSNYPTPLAIAAEAGEVEIVRLLLEYNANTQIRASDGQTILCRVAGQSKGSIRHAAVVDMLLKAPDIDPNEPDKYQRTALHFAASEGNFEIIKTLLRHPEIDPNATSQWLWNALHFLGKCENKSTKNIAELLINAGTDPLQLDTENWSPALVASRYGNTTLLEVLLEHNPDCLGVKSIRGDTALHFAFDNADCIKWLMEHGVDGNARGLGGYTTLMAAAYSGQYRSVRVLLDYGCNVDIVEETGKTALHLAASGGHILVGRELLKKHREILSFRDKTNLSALHCAIRRKKTVFATVLLEEFYSKIDERTRLSDLCASMTEDGETPLISAARTGQEEIVRQLLKIGAETEHRDKKRHTALVATVSYEISNTLEMIRALLDSRMPKHADVNAGGDADGTALHNAAWYGNMEACKELIKLDARVDVEGGRFNTALSAAAASGYYDIAMFLLEEQNAKPNLPARQFANTLSAALYSRTYDLVKPLLLAKVDINAIDIQGRTALHIATRQGSWDILKQLLCAREKGIPPADKQCRTLLHYAAMSGNLEILHRVLVDEMVAESIFDIAIDLADIDGWTPLHWACRQNENKAIVDALIDLGADATRVTNDGWTPENIAITHDATQVVSTIQERIGIMDQTKSRPTGWKVGYLHPTVTCDSCLLYVRQLYFTINKTPH